jgi:hypothetical protein
MKNLFIFDFDDTLAHSEIPVFVKMKDGKTKRLTSREFAKHKLEPGDLFDFSEFNKLIKTATPIEHNVELLKSALSKRNNKVTILTARELPYPVTYWLKTMLGLNVYVVAVAGSDPNLKKNYIEKEIKKGYKNVFFIDDNVANIMAVDTLKTKYPDVNIVTKVAEKDIISESHNSLRELIKNQLKKIK